MAESDLTEIYLVAGEPNEACIICSPSPERFIDQLRVGAFTFCGPHLLRSHVYGEELDGDETLGIVPNRTAPARPSPT